MAAKLPSPSPRKAQAPHQPNQPKAVDLNSGRDQSLVISTYLDLVGPAQFQTFSRSEISGDLKFDPNLISYGLTGSFRFTNSFIQHGPVIVGRFFPSYETVVVSRKQESSAVQTENVAIHTIGYGFGYEMQAPLAKGQFWFPGLGLFVERSDVTLMSKMHADANASAADFTAKSTLFVAYLRLKGDWYITQGSMPWGFGTNIYLPVKSWQSDSATTPEEVAAMDHLGHKSSIGLGFTFFINI